MTRHAACHVTLVLQLIPSIFIFQFSAGRTTFHNRAVKTQCFGILTFKMSYPALYLFDTQGVSRARFIANNIVSRTWHFRCVVFCNTCLLAHRPFIVKNTVCVTWSLRCVVFCKALRTGTSPVHCKLDHLSPESTTLKVVSSAGQSWE